MAQRGVQLERETLSCSICLDLLKDPVTIPCGHSYCMDCIKHHWDGELIHSCPQCRQSFTPRPVLLKSTMLAALVEELKKTGPPAAPAALCYAGAGDVACDVCPGRKRKACKSCLQCVASYCDQHLQRHYDVAPLKKHKLVEPSKELQENICSRHDEVKKLFCRTDQQSICYFCSVDEHKGHDTVSAAAERRQRELEGSRLNIQQRIQDGEKEVKRLQQEVEAVNGSADKAVEDSEKTFTELIRLVEKRSSDVKQQLRSQQEREVSRVRELQEKLEQEISELKRRDAELQLLSHTEDHNQFLLSYPSSLPAPLSGAPHPSSSSLPAPLSGATHPSSSSLPAPLSGATHPSSSSLPAPLSGATHPSSSSLPAPLSGAPHPSSSSLPAPLSGAPHPSSSSLPAPLSGAPHSSSTNIRPLSYFEDVTAALSAVRDKLQDVLREEWTHVSPTEVDVLLPAAEPASRAGFLTYSQEVTLDPNTAHTLLLLSEGSRKATLMMRQQPYSSHPDRFIDYPLVLSRESLSGRCYWEVERRGGRVFVAVAYKNIDRAGDESIFGFNDKSWSLDCNQNSYLFRYNSIPTPVSGPPSSRVGVYLDRRAGVLSFYSVVSETMTLLHRVQTTFTQPLHAGVLFHDYGATAEFCKLK